MSGEKERQKGVPWGLVVHAGLGALNSGKELGADGWPIVELGKRYVFFFLSLFLKINLFSSEANYFIIL